MANKKILIIDDDDDLVHALRLPLEAEGFAVFRANNGDSGLKMVKQVNPDLIILDVMMDTTTAGFQVSLTLRNPDPRSEFVDYKTIPILMLTAIHSTTPIRFTPDADYLPVDEWLEKPIDPESLLKHVHACLDARPSKKV